MPRGSSWLSLVTSAVIAVGCAQTKKNVSGTGGEDVMVDPAVDLEVLQGKIVRYAPVVIPYDPSSLDSGQREAVKLLIEASRVMDDLFWEQASETGPALRTRLKQPANETERALAHYLAINYGPYDRLDAMEPFINGPARPPGATFYPSDMTKEEFNRWLEAHPEDEEAFQGWFTVIRREGQKLVAVPYSKHHAKQLAEAAKLLRAAADKVSNQSLQKFLRSRADAFRSNEYRQSDMDWMDVRDSVLEVTIGPYEVYEDHLLNYKAAFESFVTIRSAEESKKLDRLGALLTDMERNLPVPEEHKNFERGASSPFVVADLVYAAGDTRAGVQTLAFNLPNDEVVREQKGSKKVMLKNISHAKFDKILTPIAGRILVDDQLPQVSFDAYFNHTLMHEISHGLGPGRIEHEGKKVPVSLLLKELYSAIEEAKADTLGVYNTLYLVGRGELPERLGKECPVTFLAGVFRSVRFGTHESHGKANLIAFNYLLGKGAYQYDQGKKRFSVDFDKVTPAVRDLAHELLMLEALGDYAGTLAFIEKYAVMDPRMQAALDTLKDIPVDIEPIYQIDSQ